MQRIRGHSSGTVQRHAFRRGRDAAASLLGVQVPLGASTVMASFIQKNDRTLANDDARMIALAYTYAAFQADQLLRLDAEDLQQEQLGL